MTLEKVLDADVAATVWSAVKLVGIAAFSAGVTYAGLGGRITALEESKADATQVAVLIEREQLHHSEVMAAVGEVKSEVRALRVEKADKP
jgi:hypothetical protein